MLTLDWFVDTFAYPVPMLWHAIAFVVSGSACEFEY